MPRPNIFRLAITGAMTMAGAATITFASLQADARTQATTTGALQVPPAVQTAPYPVGTYPAPVPSYPVAVPSYPVAIPSYPVPPTVLPNTGGGDSAEETPTAVPTSKPPRPPRPTNTPDPLLGRLRIPTATP